MALLRIRRRGVTGKKDLLIEKEWWTKKPPYYDENFMVIGDDGREVQATISSLELPPGTDPLIITEKKEDPEDVTPANEEAEEDVPADTVVMSSAEVEDLSWPELKQFAAGHNINTKKKKRTDLFDELKAAGAIVDDSDGE